MGQQHSNGGRRAGPCRDLLQPPTKPRGGDVRQDGAGSSAIPNGSRTCASVPAPLPCQNEIAPRPGTTQPLPRWLLSNRFHAERQRPIHAPGAHCVRIAEMPAARQRSARLGALSACILVTAQGHLRPDANSGSTHCSNRITHDDRTLFLAARQRHPASRRRSWPNVAMMALFSLCRTHGGPAWRQVVAHPRGGFGAWPGLLRFSSRKITSTRIIDHAKPSFATHDEPTTPMPLHAGPVSPWPRFERAPWPRDALADTWDPSCPIIESQPPHPCADPDAGPFWPRKQGRLPSLPTIPNTTICCGWWTKPDARCPCRKHEPYSLPEGRSTGGRDMPWLRDHWEPSESTPKERRRHGGRGQAHRRRETGACAVLMIQRPAVGDPHAVFCAAPDDILAWLDHSGQTVACKYVSRPRGYRRLGPTTITTCAHIGHPLASLRPVVTVRKFSRRDGSTLTLAKRDQRSLARSLRGKISRAVAKLMREREGRSAGCRTPWQSPLRLPAATAFSISDKASGYADRLIRAEIMPRAVPPSPCRRRQHRRGVPGQDANVGRSQSFGPFLQRLEQGQRPWQTPPDRRRDHQRTRCPPPPSQSAVGGRVQLYTVVPFMQGQPVPAAVIPAQTTGYKPTISVASSHGWHAPRGVNQRLVPGPRPNERGP